MRYPFSHGDSALHIAGEHAKALHDELVNGVIVTEAQADEKWNFVGKKRESLSE